MAISRIENRIVVTNVTPRFTMTVSKGKLTANSVNAWRKGGVISATFLVSNSSAVAKGGDLFEATLTDSNMRPLVVAQGGGYYGERAMMASINGSGLITVRNTGESLPANTEVRINLLYMAKQAG